MVDLEELIEDLIDKNLLKKDDTINFEWENSKTHIFLIFQTMR